MKSLLFLTAVVPYTLSTQHDKEASFQQKRFRATSMHCSSPTKADCWRPKRKSLDLANSEVLYIQVRWFFWIMCWVWFNCENTKSCPILFVWKCLVTMAIYDHRININYTSIINLPMNSTNSLCSGPTSPLLGPLHHLSFHSHLSRSWGSDLLLSWPTGQPKRKVLWVAETLGTTR